MRVDWGKSRDVSECSSAWIEHLVWGQGVEGSNPFSQTRISKARREISAGLYVIVRERSGVD